MRLEINDTYNLTITFSKLEDITACIKQLQSLFKEEEPKEPKPVVDQSPNNSDNIPQDDVPQTSTETQPQQPLHSEQLPIPDQEDSFIIELGGDNTYEIFESKPESVIESKPESVIETKIEAKPQKFTFEEYRELIILAGIKPNSIKNYTAFYKDLIWNLLDSPVELISYLKNLVNTSDDINKLCRIHNLFSILFKLNRIKGWISESNLEQIKICFETLKVKKTDMQSKKIKLNV